MLEKILDKCNGCYLCENICPQKCITMKTNQEGFWYPSIEENKCIKCGLCEKKCPLLIKKETHSNLEAYAMYNQNEKIRLESSSGGIFSLIAETILEENGVVFGAGFNKNFEVIHQYILKIEDLELLRGSKYVQSKIGNSYIEVKKFLQDGRKVLFTGTPCQIAGLKNYLGKDYKNLFCQDIICHGVPSPKVFKKYLQEELKNKNIKKINFRSKRYGWKNFGIEKNFNDSSYKFSTKNQDAFLQLFLKNISLRPSCYDCKFKEINRESDFTLADFWGIENIKINLNDDKGVSLVILNTDKAKEIFNKIKKKTFFEKVDIYEAIKYNSAMIKSVSKNSNREKFFSNLELKSLKSLSKKYCTETLITKLKRKIKTFFY